MIIQDFISIIDSDFYTGVPDSLLSPLADYLMDKYGENPVHHVIAANEGNAVGIAAGYHLATGKVPVIYMQNSGQGNMINPLASLLNEKVYGIPAIFVIGWRGEPGVKDEPQHAFQGEITVSLMKEMEVPSFVVTPETEVAELKTVLEGFGKFLVRGRQVALIVEKGALEYSKKPQYPSIGEMSREDILKKIVSVSGEDIIVSTTGKTSRELFEIREKNGEGHEKDFLTVGSMGHASSIAFGIASHKPNKRVWCIDGDGAAIMHMGSMAVIGKNSPKNLIHVVINNGTHESVGGLPTAARMIDMCGVAKSCGYKNVYKVVNANELNSFLDTVLNLEGPIFIEIISKSGSRHDLGRPTTTPKENKSMFMDGLIHNLMSQ